MLSSRVTYEATLKQKTNRFAKHDAAIGDLSPSPGRIYHGHGGGFIKSVTVAGPAAVHAADMHGPVNT
jgi:hypothetical protein